MVQPEKIENAIKTMLNIEGFELSLSPEGGVRAYISIDTKGLDFRTLLAPEESIKNHIIDKMAEMITRTSFVKGIRNDHKDIIAQKDDLIDRMKKDIENLSHYKIFYNLYHNLQHPPQHLLDTGRK